MPRKRIEKLCSVDGCWESADSKGYCRNHYARYWRTGNTELIYKGDKRNHPLYMLWWDRKSANALSEEWLDFYKFIKDISPKPEGNYLLVRITDDPYGPNNFKWQEYLKKKKTESNKEWWARKWAARQAANPGLERERNLIRKYGITFEKYNEMFVAQNGICAICGCEENSRSRTGGIKKLAVDHCHNSKKIRGLLCWRCNGTIGKIEENLELIDEMKAYILKHR